MKNNLEQITDREQALESLHGTHLVGYLNNTTYADLIESFGQPIFNQVNADGKVQFEWVFKFNGDVFTLYDWKTYDVTYTINELTTWNIGGKTYYGDFSDHIESLLKK